MRRPATPSGIQSGHVTPAKTFIPVGISLSPSITGWKAISWLSPTNSTSIFCISSSSKLNLCRNSLRRLQWAFARRWWWSSHCCSCFPNLCSMALVISLLVRPQSFSLLGASFSVHVAKDFLKCSVWRCRDNSDVICLIFRESSILRSFSTSCCLLWISCMRPAMKFIFSAALWWSFIAL